MSDTTTAPQELFREAATLIDKALGLLDISEAARPRPGMGRDFTNFAHAKAYLKFKDTPRKLRREANFLDGKDDAESIGNRA